MKTQNWNPWRARLIVWKESITHYDDAKHLLNLIQSYYSKAQNAGLNISPRNAQMMSLHIRDDIKLKARKETT